MSDKKRAARIKKDIPLPKSICDKLRLTCVLKGFSDMKCGKQRPLHDQHEKLARFFHGKPPNHPSQIKMLSEVNISYRELFDKNNVPNTNKKCIV